MNKRITLLLSLGAELDRKLHLLFLADEDSQITSPLLRHVSIIRKWMTNEPDISCLLFEPAWWWASSEPAADLLVMRQNTESNLPGLYLWTVMLGALNEKAQ